MKRLFDVLASAIAIIVLLPLFIVIALWIIIDDGTPIFFRQTRVGKDQREFRIYKFRSMYKDAESRGQLTIGGKDPRVTKSGYFIRKYKIDEFPQLLNVLAGDMSIVGPRPEVPKYVKHYSEEQLQVLSVRPGMTDPASIEFIDEDEILGKSEDPEKAYIEEILPQKLALQLEYVTKSGLVYDIKLIMQTLGKILR
ncbi:sugar transferase [Sanyastnella coralliicola]|uniref:sugar transferase n=1 Tax=Sanyastnella coralliicola TaxID=3069118 RepID=UPI0027BAEEE5|nr:sugar transferase [Longitalea sp. SCSIO 12813]